MILLGIVLALFGIVWYYEFRVVKKTEADLLPAYTRLRRFNERR